MVRRSLLLVLLGALAPAAARGQPHSGVLPIAGPAETAEKLAQELPAALAGKPVVGPDEIGRRLTREREVLRSLLAVRSALEQAEKDTLYMRRGPAVQAAQRAIDSLDTVAGRLHAPALAARAQATLALALLLSPADEQGAALAFKRAVATDPSYQPDPDRTPSRARRLFERARQAARGPTSPGQEELAILAGLTGMDRLFWIGIESGGKVKLVVYSRSRRRIVHQERMACAPAALTSTVAGRVGSYLSVVTPLTPRPVTSRPVVGPAPAPARVTTPWYRRWWVWAIAGAVVAGGVTVAVVASVPGDRSYQFNVSY